ncbi:MAG: ribosome small subunit-dependent GTPase A [Pseudomonadota bacterium]
MSSRPPQPSVTAPPDSHTDNQPRSGLVIVNYGKSLLVEAEHGALVACVWRRTIDTPVCGDRVQWLPSGMDEGVVEAVAERRSLLTRAAGNSRQKPLAANIDQVVIEAATEPALDSFLIDKYTVAAELAGATPLIVINKADLLGAAARHEIDALLDEYRAIGYRCLFTSAKYDTGIDAFRAALADRTSILVGQSGVGKSSLIKCLQPELEIATGRLSAASGQGKHTTTATTLYHLPGGGALIDSPGVRDFHLGSVEPAALARGFREFLPCLGHCRFSDCLHRGEPDCAVAAALARGAIGARRMESYRRLLALYM